MTTKADFSADEWATLVRSPMVAGMAITLADPGGPIEVVKETSATSRSSPAPRAISATTRRHDGLRRRGSGCSQPRL
jgi:hypothetical protein